MPRRVRTDLENLPERLATSGAVKIRSRLSSISGGKVLDVATGSGDFIDTLMKVLKNYDYFVGVDIQERIWSLLGNGLETNPSN